MCCWKSLCSTSDGSARKLHECMESLPMKDKTSQKCLPRGLVYPAEEPRGARLSALDRMGSVSGDRQFPLHISEGSWGTKMS